MSVDRDQRTEKPTEARRRQAREAGQVAVSRDLIAAVSLFFVVVVIREQGLASISEIRATVRGFLETTVSTHTLDASTATELGRQALRAVLSIFLPVAALVASAVLLVSVLQSGFQFRPEKVLPNPGRMGGEEGSSGVFSAHSAGRAFFALLKCVWIGTGLVWALSGLLEPGYEAAPGQLFALPVEAFAGTAIEIVGGAAVTTCLGLVALGAGDWALQRWLLERELMMTRQEVLEEMADQQVPAHTRQARSRLARRFRQSSSVSAQGGSLE